MVTGTRQVDDEEDSRATVEHEAAGWVHIVHLVTAACERMRGGS